MGVIAKYKFNNTLEANLLPEFNSEFTSDLYTVTDEVNGEVTTRTIESDSLPTLMRFGSNLDTYVEGNELALLEILDMNTSELTSCYRMFRYCKNLTSITCEWDTSNVEYMNAMLYKCNNLTTLDVSNFDTSNVTTMSNMFSDCGKLTSLDVSNFNTSKVTNMNAMFDGCNNLTTLDVSNFDTSNVTTMYAMFANCAKLTSLRCSNLTTDSLTSIRRIFKGNTNLVTLDISNLTIDTSVVTDYTEIFLESPNIKYIKCNNTDTINLVVPQLPTKTSDNQGIIICKSDITNLDIATLSSKYWNIDTSDGTMIAKYKFDKSIYNSLIPEFNSGFGGYFCNDVIEGNIITREIVGYGGLPTLMIFGSNLDTYVEGSELALLEVLDMNTSELTSCYRMFRYCKNLTTITCEWNTAKVTRMDNMFYNCSKLTSLDVSNWDTSNVTSMYTMFYNCYDLTSLDVSNWDTSNVTSMRSVFYSCNKLTSLDLSNFDTSNVTSMYQMFRGCNKLTSLDLSNFDTSNVADMGYMFYNCSKLTSLDLSNFDTSNVTDMYTMFYNCTNLTTLDLSNFDTSKVADMTSMFSNTPLLTDIGVLYMDKSSLQKLVNAMPTDLNKTLWYKDINMDGITHGNNITLKKYIEENVEIVLTSPLLEGDTIEVVDGKLCHIHKMGMVVLDGSEDEDFSGNLVSDTIMSFSYHTFNAKSTVTYKAYCNNFKNIHSTEKTEHFYVEEWNNSNYFSFYVNCLKLSSQNKDGFKQWLQANPTTVVYELASPYYEDITPLQSSLALRTFNECNIQIITALPIKTKITYRTNITSAIVMEQELDTLDSGVSLSNLIEEEVDE